MPGDPTDGTAGRNVVRRVFGRSRDALSTALRGRRRRRPHNRRVSATLVFPVPGFFGFTSVAAVKAGELHFVGPSTRAGGHTADGLPSGAGYTPQAFEATRDAVARAMAGAG